jgi:signal transduction histidine kinase
VSQTCQDYLPDQLTEDEKACILLTHLIIFIRRTKGFFVMSRPEKAISAKTFPDTTLRRLRSTPSYFFLVWRWAFWLYALIVVFIDYQWYTETPEFSQKKLAIILLVITFLQTLVVTLYTPILRILLPRLPILNKIEMRRLPQEDDEADILTPFAKTSNRYWDIAIQASDVIICGLIMYYGGALSGGPPFGYGSAYYRYGFSTIYAAAFAYRYRGAFSAAIVYNLFVVWGIFFHPPGSGNYYQTLNWVDVAGSLMDAPVVAVLSAYVATLLSQYERSRKELRANNLQQKALLKVNEIILREAHNRSVLLQKSAKQLRQGGHFQRLVLALVDRSDETTSAKTQIADCIEASIQDTELPAVKLAYVEQVLNSGERLISFEMFHGLDGDRRGIARLYLPFQRNGEVQMIIGVESWRKTPFDRKKEDFLKLAGAQLLVALDNIRLTEQTVQLAATAERGRIAREIHDGIAQLTYMLSLQAETCATQAQRMAEASEEDAELITPLTQRLEKLVKTSKQALWETRNYMFSLKPLMSGTTTLSQMLTNQLREFETISDLPVELEIKGEEVTVDKDQSHARRYAQVGAAVFRIVQEALTNAYKHANASRLAVHLHYQANGIEVSISDNGKGLPNDAEASRERIYSGHGMRGMSERAEELGGTLKIEQATPGGLQVRSYLPL